MESLKINKLEIENVKRVKAVKIEPTMNGLTIIGGKNGQGKTSVLDSIAWALGGNKYKPSEPQREGSVIPPSLRIVMNNGLIVERKGKNSDLKIIDPQGEKAGQQLLDSFVEQFALDIPKFIAQSSREKANTVLQIIGVGDKLYELEQKEQEKYNQRHAIGQIADQKKKFAKEQPYFTDVPKEPVSASQLISQQQDILAINGENQRKREKLSRHELELERVFKSIEDNAEKIKALDEERLRLVETQNNIMNSIEIGKKAVSVLQDESTKELEENIHQIDDINRKVRANLDKDKAEEDAKEYDERYKSITAEIEDIRKEKSSLLQNSKLPLDGLSVDDGELIYKGFKWDGMSGADQLKVSAAIVRKLNPKCGFVLLDKLEQMDIDTLTEFGKWLEEEGLQAIATRVSTGDECSIIIEDVYDVKNTTLTSDPDEAYKITDTKKWKEGEF